MQNISAQLTCARRLFFEFLILKSKHVVTKVILFSGRKCVRACACVCMCLFIPFQCINFFSLQQYLGSWTKLRVQINNLVLRVLYFTLLPSPFVSVSIISHLQRRNAGPYITRKKTIWYMHQRKDDICWYCRFSYAGNWELVKSIVGTKFRRSHVCLHSQVGNKLWQLMGVLFFVILWQFLYKN